MAWQGISGHAILGHDAVVDQFRRALAKNRLASTFLFIGPAGIGKRTFALKFAQSLLCDRVSPTELDACGSCPACQQVAAGSHPDVERIAKPEDKAFIPLELLIGDADHRMRAGLCYNISLKPFSGKRRIAIIDDADAFNREGANCLLKTLEEPPPDAILILIGTSEQRQLPTIRSRCQIIRFQPLSPADIETILREQLPPDVERDWATIAARSEGSLTRAMELLDGSWSSYREELLESFSRSEFDTIALAKQGASVVEAAGKDATLKRSRLKQLITVGIDFYRNLLQALATPQPPAQDQLGKSVAMARRWWPGDTEGAAVCLETCLAMLEAVDANANATNLLEYWFDEIAHIARTGRAAVR
jgi:DNA polymerase III subunit delta'